MSGTSDEPKCTRVIRRHGFHSPFDPLQILSWIMTTVLVGSFCALLAPMLSTPWSIIALAAYLLLLVFVLALGYETGRRDPIDPYVLCSEEELAGLPGLLKCAACCSRVNQLSRHCLICDKCVVDFDHHCKWLNNCIGAKNYRSFRWLIAATALLISVQLAVSANLFIKYSIDWDALQEDVWSFYINLDANVYFGLLCFNIVLGIPSLALVTHLVGFHIYLSYHQLTTYNYVMNMEAASKSPSNAYLENSSESEDESEEEEDEDEDSESCCKTQEEDDPAHVDDMITANPSSDKKQKVDNQVDANSQNGAVPRRLEPLGTSGFLPGEVS